MRGTKIDATVKRVVDGDTLYVEEFDKSIRILSLDTEESHASGGKPVTPWGVKATERARELLPEGSQIVLEFQGNDPKEDVWKRYVDNFGRGLAWVHLADGRDFQEMMIREGYSPYFNKYGNAEWSELHSRYVQAEVLAQVDAIGVWNQIMVNGSEMRNYAALGIWWELRARLIEDYRNYKQANPDVTIFNTRKDYLDLLTLAESGAVVTIFSELRALRLAGGIHGLVTIGSFEQPFELFIPRLNSSQSQQVVNLLSNRYFSSENDLHLRRGYAFVSGKLQMFNSRPQMILEDVSAIKDSL